MYIGKSAWSAKQYVEPRRGAKFDGISGDVGVRNGEGDGEV